jgi:hypothetical protein
MTNIGYCLLPRYSKNLISGQGNFMVRFVPVLQDVKGKKRAAAMLPPAGVIISLN